MSFQPKSIPFSSGGKNFQVLLGSSQVAEIEKQLNVGIFDAFNMMGRGFMSASTAIISTCVKMQTEIGFVPIPLHEIAGILVPSDTDQVDENGDPVKAAPFVAAFSEAQTALGNALGFVAASEPQSENGSDLASTPKTSLSKKTG